MCVCVKGESVGGDACEWAPLCNFKCICVQVELHYSSTDT